MRRLKMVVYLLILGILSSLLGNVSFLRGHPHRTN